MQFATKQVTCMNEKQRQTDNRQPTTDWKETYLCTYIHT